MAKKTKAVAVGEAESPNAPIWIKLFVLFHLFAIIAWSLPSAPTGIRNGMIPATGMNSLLFANEKYVRTSSPIRAYLLTTGFWQIWDMFAPDPANEDKWGDAEIVRQDGSVEHYQYPRMYLLPIHKKLVMERHRKYFERASLDSFAYLWPQFAYVIAREVDKIPKNRPVEVRLFRHWQQIPPVGEPMPKEYQSYMYWVEYIDLKILDGAPKL